MTYDEISQFFGSRCLVRMKCRACRGGHMIIGRMERGKHPGDVVLKGHTFEVQDIEGIWQKSPPSGPRRRPLLPFLLGKRLLGSGIPNLTLGEASRARRIPGRQRPARPPRRSTG